MDFTTILQLLDSTVRLATPLLLACLAGLYSERAGIFDIGLEGKMLAAAFFSAAIAAFLSTNPLGGFVEVEECRANGICQTVMQPRHIIPPVISGLIAGSIASIALSLLHGLASITFRGNQLISGVAINFLAAGITVVISQAWFAQGGRTPALSGPARFENITLPGAESTIRGIAQQGPVGQVYSELLSGHSILVYVALAMVPLTWWVLYRTTFGLRLRAVGENPGAVDTAGISVVFLRYSAVAICGLLCGLAGAYLATGLSAGFVKEMSAGRGFIALAALIFAKWKPWPALAACLLFGLLDAVSNRFQNIEVLTFLGLVAGFSALALIPVTALAAWRQVTVGGAMRRLAISAGSLVVAIAVYVFAARLDGVELDPANLSGAGRVLQALRDTSLPVQFMQALPYILTVVILAGFVGRAIPPRAGGEPYVKER
ncbi:MAG: ABC transporter permease [Pseudomonadota bacterium]